MKNFFLLFLLTIGTFQILWSQNSISGSIVDESNNPVLGAEVYIEQLHIGTTSNENGQFELQHIPKGQHKLTISFFGFNTENLLIDLDEEDQHYDIQLEPSVFHMDEVIVSAPFNKLQSENVMKIESKSLKSLKKMGAPTLSQGLTSIPGVTEYSTGNGIGKPVIRGLTGNRVLVYTQGVRLENQQFGQEHGLGLSDSGMENVEVIKGPASLLYGSDALGGVIYINPERFALQNETEVNVSQGFYSNTLGSNTSAGVKTSKGKMKFVLRGGYNAHSDYEIPEGDRVTNTRYKETDFKAGIGFNLDNFVTEFRYNLNQSKIGIPEEIGEQTTSKSPDLPYQDLETHILSLHNHLYLNQSRLDLNLGYVMNNRKEFEEEHHHEDEHEEEEEHDEEHEEDVDHPALDMKLKTFTYDLKYHFPKSERFETIAGLQGMVQTNINYGEEILIPDAQTNDIGLLINSTYEINENNSIQGGIRYDHRNVYTQPYEVGHHDEHEHEEEDHEEEEHHDEDELEEVPGIDRDYGNFTFSVGYKSKIAEKLWLRLNFANGFRAPNLAELTSYGVHHGANRFEIGDPDLESERNYQTDLSIEYRNKHFEVFANGFYNRLNNYIYLNPTGEEIDESPVYEYTQDDARLYGTEFGLHLHPHPLDWLHFESNYEMVIGELVDGGDLPLIPANKWSNVLRGEFKIAKVLNEFYASVDLDSYFEQNRVSDFETPTDAYSLLNFRLGGTFVFKKCSLGVNMSLNNALNETYTSHLSALKYDGIPNPGRNFVMGIDFNF